MKRLITAALIVAATASPALASKQSDAKRELQGWSKASNLYVETCNAGHLREQMSRAIAVDAYKCFAKIIAEEVDLQYPDLYKKLDHKMGAAHADYAAGQSWDKTLSQLAAASDEYNAAVARRNQQSSND